MRISLGLDRQRQTWFDNDMTLEEIKKAALPACREFDVGRLDVFGSTARGSAKSSSDVDLLVEFKDPDRAPARRFFGLLHQIEDALGCRVDLLTVSGLRNPYFKRRALEERVTIYEG
jgi:predicted nucleotidyltransferase